MSRAKVAAAYLLIAAVCFLAAFVVTIAIY
jgi:hypothetical protein